VPLAFEAAGGQELVERVAEVEVVLIHLVKPTLDAGGIGDAQVLAGRAGRAQAGLSGAAN
jgi:hypothetical protein